MVKVFTLDTIFGSRQRMLEWSLGLQGWGKANDKEMEKQLLVNECLLGQSRQGNWEDCDYQTWWVPPGVIGSYLLICVTAPFLGQVLLYILLQAPGGRWKVPSSLLGLENYQPKQLGQRDTFFKRQILVPYEFSHLRKTNFVHFAICPSITLLQTNFVCFFYFFFNKYSLSCHMNKYIP